MIQIKLVFRLILLISIVTFCLNANAQKKRDILLNHVISVTETTENVEDGQKPVKTGVTKFDATGEVQEELQYKNDGKFDSHVVNEYDPKGNKKKETYYNQKNQIEYTVDIEYDNYGNKVQETYLNEKGQKDKTIEFKYQNGLKIERTVLLANGKVKSKKRYTYEYQK